MDPRHLASTFSHSLEGIYIYYSPACSSRPDYTEQTWVGTNKIVRTQTMETHKTLSLYTHTHTHSLTQKFSLMMKIKM